MTDYPQPRVVPIHRSGPSVPDRSIRIAHLKQLGKSDCIRTCVAMVLGLERPDIVPCFYEVGDGKAWERARNWLWNAGYGLVALPMRPPTVQQAISRIKGETNIPVILGALHDVNDPDSGHCIVITQERVYDPAYDEPGVHCLDATHTNGEVWAKVIVPLGGWPHRSEGAPQ